MQTLATSIASLIEEFSKLPGIGPKTAQRLTYYLLRNPTGQARALAEALLRVEEVVRYCSICYNMTEQDPCAICQSPERDPSSICVVEEPLDILALEKTRVLSGRYHVLHGRISPMDGIGPDQLRIRELMERLKSGEVKEVILAMNPNLEGDATAMYLARLIHPLNIRTTRLAHGLPIGGDLEYADELTLSRALEGRREM